MHIIHKLLVLCFYLLASQYAASQPSSTFSYLHYDHNDGLRGKGIYGICQSDDGFIWIGTDNGMVRFDGTRFSSISLGSQVESKVIERIFNIGQDSMLVFGTSPIGAYLIHDNTLSKLNINMPNIVGLKLGYSHRDNSVSFWNNRNLYTYKIDNYNLKFRLPDDQKFFFTISHAFAFDSVFISTSKSAYLLGKDTVEFKQLARTDYVLDLNDKLLLFKGNQIWKLENDQPTLTLSYSARNPQITHAVQDHRGNIWFSGRNQELYLLQNGSVKKMSASLGIEGEQITYLFVDVYGNIWVSTESSGLYYIIQSAFTNYSVSDGLMSGNITCISAKEKVYIGTNTGLHLLTEQKIIGGNNLWKEMDNCVHRKDAYTAYIHDLLQYDNNLVMAVGNRMNNKAFCQLNQIFIKPANRIAYKNDTLIAGKWGTISAMNISNKFEYIKKLSRTETPYRKEQMILPMPNGEFLIGTTAGLYKASANFNNIKPYPLPSQYNSVSFNDAVITKKQIIWFATDNGLLAINGNEVYETITTSNGLNSNQVSCLALDADGRLWVGTDNGLHAYDGKMSFYSKGSGLTSSIITCLDYQTHKNVLWVGTNKGVSKLYLVQIPSVTNQSFAVYINELEIVGDTAFSPSEVTSLNWKQNHLKIRYGAINYTQPSDISYQYRLLPTDSIWRNTFFNYADYPALAPNNYQFEVRSKTAGSTWGEAASLNVTITTPYWQSIEFQVLICLLIAAIAYLLFSFRIKSIKNRELAKLEMLQKINHLEQQALSLSMNPHFIFNSLNSIQEYFSHVNNREANQFISDFAELIRLNMESSKKRFISLQDELHRLNLYLSLEQKRFEKDFDYQIIVDPELEFNNPTIPNMVIQPSVENAIWHGILPSEHAGIIKITMLERQEQLVVTVEDNGIGLTEAARRKRKQHHSHGLNITKERLAFVSPKNSLQIEEIVNDDGQVNGTKTTIVLEID